MEIPDFRGKLLIREPLAKHTSYGIGGPADVFAMPADREDLALLLGELKKRNLPFFVLGGGTNLLVRDGGFRGAVISLKHLQEIRIERQYRSIGGAFAVVVADAGALLPSLLAFSVEEGLTGLEFSAGIPGTVGGAVCMNAGTATGEIGDVIESVTLIGPDGTLLGRSREELAFGYRTSAVPDAHVVLDARLVLRRDDPVAIRSRVQELIDKRKQRQPGGHPNAGSIFKNPQQEPAGRLIEAAKLKGKKVGGAKVSEKHANFIVNTGHATAADVLQLMDLVKKAVLEVHGVRLEPEIKIIGED